jgi:hypothetical protein
MKLDRYELKSDEQFTTFDFLSEGPKGKIEKVCNLAFGDRNYLTGEIDDKVVTDNGDSEKVLASVVAAVYAFCDKKPDALIYATGSSAARTRLYKMGINKYYDIVHEDFIIFGQSESEWERFVKEKNYEAFVVQRKSIKFDL